MATRLVSVVIDCADPRALAEWWAAALAWDIKHYDEESDVAPFDDQPGIDLTFVPTEDPKVTKNRVHLDLCSTDADHHLGLVGRLIEAGARRIDIGQDAHPGGTPWVVMADPEENEFCVLEPRDHYRDTGPIAAIVVDCVDPRQVARFWADAAGWTIQSDREHTVGLRSPIVPGPWLEFNRTGEPHTVKNRVHLDVAGFATDDQAAEVERLRALGAVPVEVGQSKAEPGEVTWVVLADPEENEFCVLSSRGN